MIGPVGIAWDVSSDIHPTFRSLTSQKAGDTNSRLIIQNYVVRVLDTPPGSLPDAPGRGYDLKRLTLATMTRDELDSEAALMAEQIALDERITSADVEINQQRTPTGVIALIDITIVPDDEGPFRFTLRASELTLEVL